MKKFILVISGLLLLCFSHKADAQVTSGDQSDSVSRFDVKKADSSLLNVVLYPNPAGKELNIIYSPTANVKTIAIYNIIGKVMTVYRVLADGSANLNLENIPYGVYMARLYDSNGSVVTTVRFTRQ